MKTLRPIPAYIKHGYILLQESDKLYKYLEELRVVREKFGADFEEAIGKARILLASVTTVKKLMEIWPECQKYIPKPEPVAKLPTVRGDEVNKLIHCVKSSEGCD